MSRAVGVSEAEIHRGGQAFLPLGGDLSALWPGSPCAEGLLSVVALSGPLRPGTSIVECRAQWRPARHGRLRPDVRVLTLLDHDAAGDPARVAGLRAQTWARVGAGPVVVVGSAGQLEAALACRPPGRGGGTSHLRAVYRLDAATAAAAADGAKAVVAHTPVLGYLAGRVRECGQLHVDWYRCYFRDGGDGVLVTVLRGSGPVRVDVHVPGAALTACPVHHGGVLLAR